MTREVSRTELRSALKQRLTKIPIKRRPVAVKVNRLSDDEMPLGVMIGDDDLERVMTEAMDELNVRLGIRPDAPSEERTITLLD